MNSPSRDHAHTATARTCLRTLALALLVAGCTHPRKDVALLRYCGSTEVWQDARGHRWIGLNLTEDSLDPIVDGVPLDQLCGARK